MSNRYVEWFVTVYTGLSFASPQLKLKVQKESPDLYTSDEDSDASKSHRKHHEFHIWTQSTSAPCPHILWKKPILFWLLFLICAGVFYSALHAFTTLAENGPPNTLSNPFPPLHLLSTLDSVSDSPSNTEGQLTSERSVNIKDCCDQSQADSKPAFSDRMKEDIFAEIRIQIKLVNGKYERGLSKDQVEQFIHSSLSVYNSDKTGFADFALEPAGQCWSFRGFDGHLMIQPSREIVPTAFSRVHIPQSLATFATRNFTVYDLETDM